MADLANRRTFIKATGVAGVTALAGCSGGGNGDDGEGTTTGGETTTEGGSSGQRISWHAGGTGGTY